MLPTVIETIYYQRQAERLLSLQEREAICVWLASNPKAGNVVKGADGARKVRWAVGGKGKSGGVRIIYLNITAEGHIYLLAVYAKNERENMSAAEIKRSKK